RLAAFAKWKQRRIAARVRVRPPGWTTAVTVCTTHLSLPAFLEVGPLAVPRSMGHGSNQLAEVERLCDALDTTPPGVMGDFNSEPGSPAYAAMEARGWVPAPAGGPTASFLHHRMHLDHLFGSGVRWGRARVVTEAEGLSDHLPKIAELTI